MHRAALVPLPDMGLSDKDTGLFVSGQRHLGVESKLSEAPVLTQANVSLLSIF